MWIKFGFQHIINYFSQALKTQTTLNPGKAFHGKQVFGKYIENIELWQNQINFSWTLVMVKYCTLLWWLTDIFISSVIYCNRNSTKIITNDTNPLKGIV